MVAGPYQVTQLLQRHGKSLVDKPRYTIRNLVTDKKYVVDVTHIRPFYYDPTNLRHTTQHGGKGYRRDGGRHDREA